MFNDFISEIDKHKPGIIPKENKIKQSLCWEYGEKSPYYVCPKCQQFFKYNTIKCQFGFKELKDDMYEHVNCGGHIDLI